MTVVAGIFLEMVVVSFDGAAAGFAFLDRGAEDALVVAVFTVFTVFVPDCSSWARKNMDLTSFNFSGFSDFSGLSAGLGR